MDSKKRIQMLIAECQGDVFRYVAERYDLPTFANCYMRSAFVNNHLDRGSTFDLMYPPELLYNATLISPEIKDSLISTTDFLEGDVAQYIGETYRLFAQEKHIPSGKIIERLPVEYMISTYEAYHTFVNDEYLLSRVYEDYCERGESHDI